jgi:raffinose/stachyose/melibiose transport system permease protein
MQQQKPIWIRIFLFLSTVVMILPLYITVINSFKSTESISKNAFSLFPLTLENFIYAFTSPNINIYRMYFNSVLITLFSVIFVIIFSSMAGFYLARATKASNKYLSIFFLMGLMVPFPLIIIPIAKIYTSLGLISTLPGLFLFYLGVHSPFSIFLYSNFLKTIPRELEEAAFIDGSSQLRAFWTIVFPLIKPCTATAIIYIGLFTWNDFLSPLILLGGTGSWTITIGIYTAIGPYKADLGHVFAFVMLASLPILLLYVFLQKQFIGGLTTGALKM